MLEKLKKLKTDFDKKYDQLDEFNKQFIAFILATIIYCIIRVLFGLFL